MVIAAAVLCTLRNMKGLNKKAGVPGKTKRPLILRGHFSLEPLLLPLLAVHWLGAGAGQAATPLG